jgi:pyridoxal phosphate enzyme (YggS family)
MDIAQYQSIVSKLHEKKVTLVAVSKTKSAAQIMALYNAGQRDFGENYVQELLEKQEQLPKDIRWHFIGHLQSNKVKYIAPFIHLIHSADSLKLLKEINKQAVNNNRTISCLLQIYIAQEETKFGLDFQEAEDIFKANTLSNIFITGLMGMASNTENIAQIKKEYQTLKSFFDNNSATHHLKYLSMGMSGDYDIAIAHGSNMVRIGSLLFGARNYNL